VSALLSAPGGTREGAEERKPGSLVLGMQLARALSGIAAIGLVAAVIGFSIRRYRVEHTALNVAGPAYAFFVLVALALAVIALVGVRAATRTLRVDDTGGRDVVFGYGAAGSVIVLIVTIVLFDGGHPLAGAGGVVWLVLTLLALAAMSTPAASAWLAGRAPALNVLAWIRANLLLFLGLLVMAFLYIPNLVVAAMSFNQEPTRRTTYQWYSFSFHNWTHVCEPAHMCGSVVTSLWIGVVATVVATLFGTLAAFALARRSFAGRSTTNTVLFLPMATPDIVMGSSLLAFFVALRLGGHLGHGTIIVAHVMFCLSFVVVTVKARLAGLDSTLQQAAMDLYANESQTFWRVTFPLVFPGILAAALLAFSLSFDDFIITNLNAGTVTTFPIFVWGAALRGLPMQVNVIGTMMFVLAIVLVVAADLLGRSRAKGKA
jgi:spermidine/putrescine transport system permease protein